MQKAPCPYNTRLQKGGALLDDMRLLVRQWSEVPAGPQGDAVVVENLLGKETRSRAFEDQYFVSSSIALASFFR